MVTLEDTVSQAEVYEDRTRLCDLSYLRQPYERANGTVGYRCAGEPVHMYVKKGGTVEDTVGRKCLCNGLTATIGMGQHRKDGYDEAALVTLGEDLDGVEELVGRHPQGWSATDAVAYLVEQLPVPTPYSARVLRRRPRPPPEHPTRGPGQAATVTTTLPRA